MTIVYLLHFTRPVRGRRHYIGVTENLDVRIEEHRKGKSRSSLLSQTARKLGISFELARVWADVDPSFERTLKRRKDSSKLCPICSPVVQSMNRDIPAGPGFIRRPGGSG